MESIKKNIYNLIRDDDENNLASNIFDGVIITLIIINVVTIIISTFDIPPYVQQWLDRIEIFSVVVFTIEYLLRLWTSPLMYRNIHPFKARIRYIFSFMAMVDLLSILPFYLPFLIKIDLRVLRSLRLIRLLRILKVNRYTSALSQIGSVFKKKASQLISALIIVGLLIVIASILMYNVENPAQPEQFKNAFSGVWWAVATLTTVGYGDIYPITTLGRVLSGIIALLGIGLVAVPTGIISSGFIENIDKDCKENKKCFCPYCGEKLE